MQRTYTEYQPNRQKYPLSILLQNVDSPHNVGMIFRLVDTLGVAQIILTGKTPTPPHRNISRAATGAYRHVDWCYELDILNTIKSKKQEGYTIIALEITHDSEDIKTLDYKAMGKILLIAGAEDGGISDAVLQVVDATVHIPTHGVCLSMNVATALSIAVYEICRAL